MASLRHYSSESHEARASLRFYLPFHFVLGEEAGDESAACTASGSLPAFATMRLTCQACVSESDCWNPGMPDRRIPLTTFQYDSPTGSSVTPLPRKSCGGLGNIPEAIAVTGCPGSPWQTAQLSRNTRAPARRLGSSAGMGTVFGISRVTLASS